MAKLLLAEDDNNLREIYQARLTAEGYDVIAAQNGEEALVLAKQNHPDLVISDVMMPRISGFEMLDILRNTDELKHTKVIMLTALGQADDRGRADNLGADKYLVKSQVTLEDIVASAHELLGESTTVADSSPVATDQAAAAPAAQPTTDAAQPVIATPPADPTTPAADIPAVDTGSTGFDVSALSTQSQDSTLPVAAADEPSSSLDSTVAGQPIDDPTVLPEPAQSSAPLPTEQEAEASVAAASPQSAADEEQALEAQITDLVGSQPQPAESATVSQPEVSQSDPVAVAVEPTPSSVEPIVTTPSATEALASAADAADAQVAMPGQVVVPSPETESNPPNNQVTTPPTVDLAASSSAEATATPATPAEPTNTNIATNPEATGQTPADSEPQKPIINPDINNIAL